MPNTITVRQALAQGITLLRPHRCDGVFQAAPQEAEALLAKALGLSRERLFMAFDRVMTAREQRAFMALVARRAKHAPLAWLLGSGWFMGREFGVNEHTLIPRPATESVVTAAVEAALASGASEAVDVGTGSGCIAVSLALALPKTRVFATDASIPAIVAARRNARLHGVADRVTFRKTNLLGFEPTAGHASRRPLPLTKDGPALLVANLPYLPTGMRAKLSACVRREPPSALFSGKDGLDASRALLRQVASLRAKRPAKRVILAFEILPRQYAPLAAATRRAFPGAAPQRITNHQGVTVGLLARIG